MLEFQSGVDWFMALRVQGYAVRLWEGVWRGRLAQFDSFRAEGLNEGIEHERKLLTRLAERKLGAGMAERVGELLSRIFLF